MKGELEQKICPLQGEIEDQPGASHIRSDLNVRWVQVDNLQRHSRCRIYRLGVRDCTEKDDIRCQQLEKDVDDTGLNLPWVQR